MMKFTVWLLTGSAVALALAGPACATTIDLGPSAENYVLFGQGEVSPGVGSFTNQQGFETFNAVTNTTTETLTGAIAGSSDPSLSSGTYSLVTTFSGKPIGAGGAEIQSQSIPDNLNYFEYSYFDPSVSMTLYLQTLGGARTISLVSDAAFEVDNFGFTYTTATCTGVTTCTQNNVGLTPGATQFGPVTTFVDFTTVSTPAAPEPGSWALLLTGVGLVGLALRRQRLPAFA